MISLSWAQPPAWKGTWSATAGGRKLAGSWTARVHAEPTAGWGFWSLLDPSGKQLATGSWSARKAERSWQGNWQAQYQAPSKQAFSGTWTARSNLDPSAALSELLQSALADIVSGTWGTDKLSGNWSIRTYAGN